MAPRPSDPSNALPPSHGSALEVFITFLRLGCTSFGGPTAHLGYFQKELVERRQWCSPAAYAEIVALAQSLPGPASSQVGFALGLLRAGWPGALAAWTGFTLPSAALMVAFAAGHAHFDNPASVRVYHGLQLAAVAVVAHAVLTMRRSLAPDAPRLFIAAAGAAIALLAPTQAANLLAILAGALAGLLLCRAAAPPPSEPDAFALSPPAAILPAILFLTLLGLTCLGNTRSLAVFSAFYRTGALVFGGGHVVLPLLQHQVVDRSWVTQQSFLTGYGAAQAMPGPLFSFAAYLGAVLQPIQHPLRFAALALVALFAPGLLLMAAVLPAWAGLRRDPRLRAALSGLNAAVVGILAAALLHPLLPSTVRSLQDLCLAVAAFALLNIPRVQAWMVVVTAAAASFLLH